MAKSDTVSSKIKKQKPVKAKKKTVSKKPAKKKAVPKKKIESSDAENYDDVLAKIADLEAKIEQIESKHFS